MTSVTLKNDNRRDLTRYAVNVPVRYRAAGTLRASAWKRGDALDMSARGIRIAIRETPAIGSKFEISMDWTGLYHGTDLMRLYLTAEVVRVDAGSIGLRILSHEFRNPRAAVQRVRQADRKLAVA